MIKKTVQQPIMEEVLTQTGVREVHLWETSDGIEHYSAESALKHEWHLSVKRKEFIFPYYAVSYYFRNQEDLVEFEREHISRYNKKNYNSSNISFPCHMVSYQEEDISSEGEGYELVNLVPYEKFKEMIYEELNSAMS